MRAGLSTIQQTLTPEAASVLNHSIAEASRRNHGQTTPLHVAATLLGSPSGFLRQACIKSHPNSSHPLQCRALELCFSVALERLPTAQNLSPGLDPPISNALMAALKRAQAHQRRGCPEQQQQPLLAVKVELEQLIISILDDPSVSRVMREASFSSPAVKATIEQSLNASTNSNSAANSGIGLGFRAPGAVAVPAPVTNRNLYVNPRLQQGSVGQSGAQRNEEVKKVIDILLKSKKRNPVLLVSLTGSGGVQQQQIMSDVGRSAVAEMRNLLGRFGEGSGGGKVWLIGTATCETYLRCQVYHPSMENDWDLQAVPIAARALLPGTFHRLGTSGILSSSVESLSPLKGFPTVTLPPPRRVSENLDPARIMSCCPGCMQNYEQELAKLVPKEAEKSSEIKSEAAQPPLPQWLRNAKSQDGDVKISDQTVIKDQELMLKQKKQELQKKWHDTCLRLHPAYHQPNLGPERITQPALSMTSLYNQNLLPHQPFQPKLSLNKKLSGTLVLNPNLLPSQPAGQATTQPGSPVRTDLVLGRLKVVETTPEKEHEEHTKDFLSCVPSEPLSNLHELPSSKLLSKLDNDSFKKLLKGLLEKVWWQRDAASAVATTVTQCKLGHGKSRSTGSKGDIWLLFTGPDRAGKKKMASALSELVCVTNPIMVCLGSRREDGESVLSFRGKTVLDRIAEAVRRNPFSVIVLEDIDEADMLVRGSIKRAMERGRIADSLGREISLGNVIFILTANRLPDNPKFLSNSDSLDEKKLASLASGGWQLKLTLSERRAKRRANWLHDEERSARPRTDLGPALAFDLNEAADAGGDRADGSHNSSDLTVDHEDEHVLNNRLLTSATSSISKELLNSVDDHIVFKPADFSSIRRDISSSITKKFSTIFNDQVPIEIQDEALEKITGGLWLSQTGLDEWTDNVLVPSLRQLKLRLPTRANEPMIVQLEPDTDSDSRSRVDWLPSSIRVVVDGL
ncbi:hypothetical protein D5086_013217 [Populus alba]|uniref:Uncharacterized protein n=1 Tax=Populus alba TaxID=43335 RepID=A0ACC4C4T5_POPAL